MGNIHANECRCFNCVGTTNWHNAGCPDAVFAKSDPVNHPEHYQSEAQCECGKSIECIQVIEHMSLNVGNAVKYLWRHGKKDDTIQDLKKAAWFVAREIKRLEASGRSKAS